MSSDHVSNNTVEFDCSLPSEDCHGGSRGPYDCSLLANSAMVLTAATLDNRHTEDTSKTSNHTQHARERTRNTSTMQKDGFVGVQIIRESLESQGISKKAGDIILQSWRQGTHKQYASYIKRWISFCGRQQIDCVSPTIPQALDFLVELLKVE